jgi:hypothetical protein
MTLLKIYTLCKANRAAEATRRLAEDPAENDFQNFSNLCDIALFCLLPSAKCKPVSEYDRVINGCA